MFRNSGVRPVTQLSALAVARQSSVHGITPGKECRWVPAGESSQPEDQTQVSTFVECCPRGQKQKVKDVQNYSQIIKGTEPTENP